MAYFSEKLTGPHTRYSTYDVEFYVVVRAVRYWRHYLFHREFVLYTYHEALKHLANQDSLSTRHAKWCAFLQQFTFVVKHQSGASNRVADALSWRNCLLSDMRVIVSGFDSFRELYTFDPFLVLLWVQLRHVLIWITHLQMGFCLKISDCASQRAVFVINLWLKCILQVMFAEIGRSSWYCASSFGPLFVVM